MTTSYTSHLIQTRKLLLVVDLDHTVIHATHDIRKVKCAHPGLFKDNSIIRTRYTQRDESRRMTCFVKLRPHVRTMLEMLKSRFEMCVYTLSERAYAERILQMIDPDGTLFQGKMVTRDENDGCLQFKSLERIECDVHADMVVILDDKTSVWHKSAANVLQVHAYHFWDICKSLNDDDPSVSLDEYRIKTDDNVLCGIANVLITLHTLFYAAGSAFGVRASVPSLLRDIKKSTLHGRVVFFSGIFSRLIGDGKLKPQDYHEWQLAEELGATCKDDVVVDEDNDDETVTHLITTRHHANSHKNMYTRHLNETARKHNQIAIVDIRWLYHAAAHFVHGADRQHATTEPVQNAAYKHCGYENEASEEESVTLKALLSRVKRYQEFTRV
jgi:FCP1-like phosphatase family protein